MYGDDTSLTYASGYVEVIIVSVLYNLKSTSKANRLSFNVAMHSVLSLALGKAESDGRAFQPALVVSDDNISIVENISYLVVIVDHSSD